MSIDDLKTDEEKAAVLSELLIHFADLPLPTWQEKREWLETHLSESGYAALSEIASWGWDVL